MAWSWTSSIPPSLEAPSLARTFVEASLGSAYRDVGMVAETCDDLVVIVSELVTNAVRAGSGEVGLTVGLERGRVVVRVTDSAVGWPEPRTAAIDDPGGRGLPLVAALSAAWGVRLADTGKTVWAELAVSSG